MGRAGAADPAADDGGHVLDGISIFLIFVPLLMPIANAYGWDPVWFGVILTLKVALGQFTRRWR